MSTTIVGIQALQTGYPGAPGYTTLYFEGADANTRDAACDAAFAFWTAMKAFFPPAWTVALKAESPVLDDVTGALLDYHPTPGAYTGTLTGADGANRFAAGPAGACIAWGSTTINWSRRVRGRTFLVPIGGSAVAADGTLEPGVYGNMVTGAEDLRDDSGSVFGVWSRPRTGAGGKFAPVTSVHIKDQAAVLRSRR